ncbi:MULTISPECIES: CPBP family intramembrane glutamic endopeptidase [unclassified Solwaraspora]|uniref:CPBP family intramembrane glutamic endopeptidase n=1 Tax=unclassified Solwaraspora TaxID=2627926 RepID=UPI00259AFAE9|nr:CPBP family intramembrane glutamic endopeptidase [Solwaraspora sp. WMMA2056]WJK40731.1 CPBP family intramembrane metalloprotease [Solwaraspora sp. WMMA2056]
MTTTISTNSLLAPAEPRDQPSVPQGVEYHRVLAGDKRRIGRGILAIVLLLAGIVIFPTVIGRATALIDVRMGNTPPILGGTDYTPLAHASAMLALGLLVPWSMLIQRWLYGVPGSSLHSVTSRFRFDLLGRSLLIFGPAWLVVNVLGALTPVDESPWSQTDLIAIFVATMLLTPLQSAGEEYGVRGLIFRVIGSWTRSPRAGLVAGVLVSSVLFTAVHGATDPYIIVWYFVLWSGLAVITWRTGGLEIAVMLHAVLNTFTFILATSLRVDLGSALQDRSAGVGTPYQLVPTVAVIVIAAIIWWRTRKTGPALTPQP